MELFNDLPIGKIVPMAIWGFLVGFVGYGSLFRLGEPIGDWLVPLKKNANVAQGIVRVLVLLFLFLGIQFMLVGAMSVLFGMGGTERTPKSWKGLFFVAYHASLAGLFFFGLIRRVSGKL